MDKSIADKEPSSNLLKIIELQNEELGRLMKENEELVKELKRKEREINLHNNSEEIKMILEENQDLKKRIYTLEDYIEVLKKKTQDTEKGSKKKLSDKDLLTHFEEDGWTAYKISKKYGVSQQTVIGRLKKMGKWEPKQKGNQFKKATDES